MATVVVRVNGIRKSYILSASTTFQELNERIDNDELCWTDSDGCELQVVSCDVTFDSVKGILQGSGTKEDPYNAYSAQPAGHGGPLLSLYEFSREIPPPLNVSTHPSSQHQTDEEKQCHPESVTVWTSCFQEVHEFAQTSLDKKTRVLNPPTHQTFKGCGREGIVSSAWFYNVLVPLNNALQYGLGRTTVAWKNKTTEEAEAAAAAERGSPASGGTAPEEAGPSASYTEAPSAAAQQTANKQLSMDFAMMDTEGPNRKTHVVNEMKRPECFQYQTAASQAPDLVALWNEKPRIRTALWKNAVGVISQVTRYAAHHGMRYAAISCYTWTWLCRFNAANRLEISPPLLDSSGRPTVYQAMLFLTVKGVDEPKLERWTPAKTLASGAVWAAKKTPRSKAPRGDGGQGGGGGGAPGWGGPGCGGPGGGGSRSGGNGEGGSGRDEPAGPVTRLQKRRRVMPGHAGSHSLRLAAKVRKAAATFEIAHICDRLGHGASGVVFLARMASVEQAAVKLANKDDEVADMLLNEGKILQLLQPLCMDGVPKLLAAGSCLRGRAVMVATQYIKGRHLDPADPTHKALLPAAKRTLAAIHSYGVLHGDLRPSNIMVTPEHKVIFIDFGSARLSTDEEKQDDEQAFLAEMVFDVFS